MSFNPLAFLELFVVFAFGIGWAILELVTLRMDKRKAREAEEKAKADEASRDASGDSESGRPGA